jgi:Domain of unknown function (DUF1854)
MDSPSPSGAITAFDPARCTLVRDAHGHLRYTDAAGAVHEAVVPVRAFPLEAPEAGVSIVGTDGHELAWIDRLDDLDAPTQALLREEFAQRDFMPMISRLVGVSTFSTPSTWTVETDRGPASLVLKGEEDIRRLKDGGLLITDSHGLTYRIRQLTALDRGSRRLLDRFL